MKYIGLDLGTRTLGVSISDTTKTIATAYGTIHFKYYDRTFKYKIKSKEFDITV